jgi:single-strand DNA-binding protein
MSTLKGKIYRVFEEQIVSEKFRKQEFVLETEDKYPHKVIFQLTNDNVALLQIFKGGYTVEVSYNIQGREWVSPQGETKYFNTLVAWKIRKLTSESAPDNNNNDDIPF